MRAEHARYLDANAALPLSRGARSALERALKQSSESLEGFEFLPNPSSVHFFGRQAKKEMSRARDQVARSLGVQDSEQILFTSGGTESNQLALRGHRSRSTLWLTTSVEHDSSRALEGESPRLQVEHFSLLSSGGLDLTSLEARLKRAQAQDERPFVSAIWVGNETGVIHDVEALDAICAQASVPLHLDGAQAWGKLPIDLSKFRALRSAAFSGHKIGAPAGIGALWLGPGFKPAFETSVRGKQEKGRRGGTENLLGILALGGAAEDLDPIRSSVEIAVLRDHLESRILKENPGVEVNGVQAPRVANTSSLTIRGLKGEGLVLALDLEGFCVSSGSACSSGALEPSHVLLAMGRSRDEAMSSIRVSLCSSLTRADIDAFCDAFRRVLGRIQHRNPAIEILNKV